MGAFQRNRECPKGSMNFIVNVNVTPPEGEQDFVECPRRRLPRFKPPQVLVDTIKPALEVNAVAGFVLYAHRHPWENLLSYCFGELRHDCGRLCRK
ncbi:hypothetical protein QQP08_010798 [Theobroma cacao]|uniref:Uncharacterized protein n=1 Tax=Theobroma cacao TaxID=3641 RepID=A0A061G7U5_THECC|nr:Uncharacterized protein TCM_016584 [Theobroma cacao]WRX18311.1 hypothetical protein QQP08_010798 [Theobroma cacao]